jgi:hypothetical protein
MRRTIGLLALAAAAVAAWPAAGRQDSAPSRAAWWWDASAARADDAARAAVLDLAARERIGTLWVQVSTEPAPEPGSPARTLADIPGWRRLIADAHRRGIRVEALDGDPTWALQVFHAAPLAVVDAVRAYNAGAAPHERFDGLHFDIEPYTLLSWRYPRSREQVLRELLDVVLQCQARARAAGLQFGVDVPFWWDAVDSRTGRPVSATVFEGAPVSAVRVLIDRLDNVGIMNYRNAAEGPDGMIANGTALLAYASRAKGARVYMGVETTLSDPSDVWFVAGPPTEVIDERLQSPSSGVGADNRFFGFRLTVMDDGENSHVGLTAPDGMGPEPTAAFADALVHLGRRFSASADARFAATAETRRDRGMWTLTRNPEWRNPVARTIRDSRDRHDYLGFSAASIMLPKITFAGLPAAVLRREMALAETAFGTYPAFAGMAIHDVKHLRAIVDR